MTNILIVSASILIAFENTIKMFLENYECIELVLR